MHTIAVCDNIPEDSAILQNLLDDYELAMNDILNVKCFTDAESMLEYFRMNDSKPELLFVNISLPGISGIEAVRKLRDDNFTGEVIFTASSPDYAFTAFELNARQYFLKPLNQQKVFTVLEQVLHSRKEYIAVKSGRSLRRLKCRDILYCETHGKYQIIHMRTEQIRVRLSSREIRTLVPPPRQ